MENGLQNKGKRTIESKMKQQSNLKAKVIALSKKKSFQN